MTMYRLNGVPANVRALPILQSVSGRVASFNTDLTDDLVEVKCQILAKQGGSGTPSPDNERPITTYTSLNLAHSGADTSNPNITNIPFGQTVAKGTLNVTTGVLDITHGCLTCGSTGWVAIDTGIYRYSNFFPYNIGTAATDLDLLGMACENFSPKAPSVAWASMPNETYGVLNNAVIMRDNSCVDATAFGIAVNGCKVVYPLATPQEIQLDSNTITALLNENNIWCDTGDTEVKYWMSIDKYIGS